jgi:hypothetical protein
VEAASEKGPRRGRPKVFDDRLLEAIGSGGPNTRRGQQERAYAYAAMKRAGILEEPSEGTKSRLGWLVDGERARWGILAQLGRIEDPETFREALAWVLEERPKAKDAEATIRRMRTGRVPQEQPAQLYRLLLNTVEGFRASHPDAGLRYVEQELELALETVRYLRVHARGG